MAHLYDITNEELQQIIAFVEDGDEKVMTGGAINKFYALSAALGRKLIETNQTAAKKNFLLERKIDSYRKKEETAVQEGIFEESGLDSVDVALALLYCLQQVKTYQLSQNKLVYILYEMYASWLASKKQRLFVEHPCAHPDGPRFWRVFNRIQNVKSPIPVECYSKIANLSPAIAAFTKRAATKYYDYKESDLKTLFKKSRPYINAMPDKNNGKWSKEITDSDIFVWKSSKQ